MTADSEPPRIGFTDEQRSFVVPPTVDVIRALLPQNWTVTMFLIIVSLLTQLALTVADVVPIEYYIVSVVFWRLMYNAGLGLILHLQSNYRWFTNLYARNVDGRTCLGSILHRLAKSVYHGDSSSQDAAPHCLNAWFAYRQIVDIILFHDSIGFLYLCLKVMHWPTWDELTPTLLARFAAGLVLIRLNYWAKVDAHRCIGDWAWYWEDFFYRVPQDLKFDGIFEYFPHPMYTVGYSLYYGAAVITQSYTVLFVTLFVHACQIIFLVLVENPHIERTYGSSEQKVEDNRSVLYDPSTGLFPDRKDAILLVDVDPFRASDLALIIFVCYGLGFCALVTEKWWCIVHAAVWRVAHFAGLGIVLWRQGRSQYWTSHFTQRGRSLHEAFDNWKRVYNLSLTMNMFVFFGAAVRYFEWPVEGWLNPSFLAHFLGGLALISINYWSMTSSYAAIGDFGFFYGDFFIPKKDYQAPLVYTGIYRFLNDPDCVTGVAGLHGLALICRSWTIFALALGSQLLQLAFLHLVEIPYMNKLYTNAPLKQHDALSPSSSRRKHSPFRAKIISKLRTVFAESIEEAASEDAAPQAVPAAKSAKSAKTKAATPKAAVATPKVATPKAASAETPRARQRKQSAAETNVTEPSPKAVRTPRAKKQA